MRKIDLGWMRILSETVRLGSFSAAATSLGMTQPAVSYQIRRLEEQAGVALLRRHRHGVELTAAGRKLHEIARVAVAEVESLMRELDTAAARPIVRLRTDYAFSSLWLIPRMHAFRTLHPGIDIQIVATQRFDAAAMEENDIAIAFGDASDFGGGATILLPEEVVPVCTQAYRERNGGFVEPRDLLRTRLIHLDAADPSPWFDWQRYFDELDLSRDGVRHQGDLSFNTYSLVTQAAIENQGVALGWKGLIDALLLSRGLVAAGPALRAPHRGYWLVPPRTRSAPTDRLASWLLAADADTTSPATN